MWGLLYVMLLFFIFVFFCQQRDGFTTTTTSKDKVTSMVLMGDSVLNNESYVPEGKSVADLLRAKTEKVVVNVAKDGATIPALYAQLEKLPTEEFNKSQVDVFVSIGGNDILNSRTSPAQIEQLFASYREFVKALRSKLTNANIHLLNVYTPANPRYQAYQTSIDQWNTLLQENASNMGERYSVVDVHSLLTKPEDFVYDIEPSVKGSEKIATLLLLG